MAGNNNRDTLIGNGACFLAYLIFGFNIVFCKSIANSGVISPMALFLFSALYALPFGLKDLLAVDFAGMERVTALQLAFVVVAATFISYFLIPIGQKRLRPVVVCMYCYVQPVVAMAISLAVGLDTMSWGKAIATLCIFLGVGIVNFAKDK